MRHLVAGSVDKVQPYIAICMRHLVAGSVDKVQPYSSLPRPPHPHPFSPSLTGLMVSVDVKHHVYLLIHLRVSFGGATDNSINREHTIQFKNFNHPTRGNLVVVMAGS